MESLLIILFVLAEMCGIAIVYMIGKHMGSKNLKESLNDLTVREMLEHKRNNFKSI